MVNNTRVFGVFLLVLCVCAAEELRYPSSIRDKRTLGFLLKTFADAIGYDVQKRPSVLPLGAPPQPVKPAAAPPAAAPAAAPAPAGMMPPAAAAPASAPAKPPPSAAGVAPPPSAPAAGAAPPPSAPAAGMPVPGAAAGPPPSAPAAGGAAPAPPVPPPPPATPPTPPPLLTETIQKRFNLNFNWNRNVQPPAGGTGPAAPAAGPGAAPASGAAAPPPGGPAPGAGPTGPAAGAPPSGDAAPPPGPAGGPLPGPAGGPLPAPAGPGVVPGGVQPKVVPAKYQQNGVIYYPNHQINYQNPQARDNQQNDFPQTVNIFWQNSPWNRKNLQPIAIADPHLTQTNIVPNGEQGYHIRRIQQNANIEHQDLNEEPVQPEENYNQAENNVEDSENEQEHEEQQRTEDEPEEDNNYDTSRVSSRYQNKPRGFLPAAHVEANSFQGAHNPPGLPLAIHGVLEDKVLLAWPAPFDLAGTEIKTERIPIDQQPQYSNQEEFKYEPESYGQYNFFTIPPPAKYEYSYDGPKDPNIEEELSKNAQVSETKFGNKYTTINADRKVVHH